MKLADLPGRSDAARNGPRAGLVLLGSLAAVFILRWPLRSAYFYEWDSVQFALGARHFDINLHQPHPPGYPLWVLLIKGLGALWPDPNEVQILLAMAATAGALAALYLLAQQLGGRLQGLVAWTLFLWAPPVVLYSTVATTYPVDLLSSAWLALLAASLWRGRARLAPGAALVLALLAGVRQSGAVFMGPLLLVATARALRGDLTGWLKTLAAGAAGALLWLVPTARLSGGLLHLLELNRVQMQASAAATSALYGASWQSHLTMVAHVVLWIALAVFVPLAAVLVLRRVTPPAAASASEPQRAPSWHRPAFYALWLLPQGLFILLVHSNKPGYTVLLVPPLVLLLSGPLTRAFTRLAQLRCQRPPGEVAAWGLVLITLLQTGIVAFPYESAHRLGVPVKPGELMSCSLEGVRFSDHTLSVFSAAVRGEASYGPAYLVVLGSLDHYQWGLNWRKLLWYAPELPVVWSHEDGRFLLVEGDRTRTLDRLGLKKGTQRLLFLLLSQDDVSPLRRALPSLRLVLSDSELALYSATLPDGPLPGDLAWQGRRLKIDRE